MLSNQLAGHMLQAAFLVLHSSHFSLFSRSNALFLQLPSSTYPFPRKCSTCIALYFRSWLSSSLGRTALSSNIIFLAMFHNPFWAMKTSSLNFLPQSLFLPADPSFFALRFSILEHFWQGASPPQGLKFVLNIFPYSFVSICSGLHWFINLGPILRRARALSAPDQGFFSYLSVLQNVIFTLFTLCASSLPPTTVVLHIFLASPCFLLLLSHLIHRYLLICCQACLLL